jgi:hypothetical protein
MKLLQTYEVRADIFNKILYDLSIHTKYCSDLTAYSYGYSDKTTIYYNEEYLICRECVLDYYCEYLEQPTFWKQVKVRKVENVENKIQATITGNYAWNYMFKLLKKYYSDEEIDKILHAHECEKDEGFKQFHYNIGIEPGTLLKIPNCFKYDINGAHCDSVVELFPKARKEFLKLYKQRKEKPIYKQLFNFFVGEMCRKGYRLTYNWIVQRTTKRLYEAMDLVEGELIYANTDGFIIQNPKKQLQHSTELFEFKEEYSGDVYVYKTKNYILYQLGDDKVGSCACEVRKDIDLSQGIVVEYDRKFLQLGTNPKTGRPTGVHQIVNKEIKKVNIDE